MSKQNYYPGGKMYFEGDVVDYSDYYDFFGWNLNRTQNLDEINALKFTANGNQTISVKTIDWSDNKDLDSRKPNLEYSTDGVNWNTWGGSIEYDESEDDNIYVFTPISFDNSTIYVRGNNQNGISYYWREDEYINYHSSFVFSNENTSVFCEGNVMHLLGENVTEIPCDYCFSNMFAGCSSLTQAPELPATTLANYCYEAMFYRCTSLTTAPILPATTLASNCYQYMFNGCTSLTTAPVLPATTLAKSCYSYMFYDCSSLNYIKMMATNISANYCLTYWAKGVASTGTFVKNAAATWNVTGVSGVPTGWTIQTA